MRRSRPARCRGGSPRARTESPLPSRFGIGRRAFRRRETYAWSVFCAESGGSSGHSSSISCPTGTTSPGVQGEDREQRPLPSTPDRDRTRPHRRRRTGRGTGSPREPPAGTRSLPARDSQAEVSRLQAGCAITLCMNASTTRIGVGSSSRRAPGSSPSARWGTAPGANGDLVFRRYFDDSHTWGAIFTTTTSGRNVRQLTHPPKSVLDNVPDWSPDGSAHRIPAGRSQRLWAELRDGRHLGRHERREAPHARRVRPCRQGLLPPGQRQRGRNLPKRSGLVAGRKADRVHLRGRNPKGERTCVVNADGTRTPGARRRRPGPARRTSGRSGHPTAAGSSSSVSSETAVRSS